MQSLGKFLEWAAEKKITLFDLPTAYWHEMAFALPEITLPKTLRLVIVGGEEVNIEAWKQWSRHAPPKVRLANTYGPTETTIIATVALLEEPDVGETRAPIGNALGNSRVYVLNPQGEPVPTGVAGELYIGGAGVSTGYWKRESLTASRFLADPFSSRPGARMYRTGDKARWREDGQLEFLGRLDFQIKLRGFRIEPGEIETTLTSHPEIEKAIVIPVRDANGFQRLEAHISAKPEKPLTTSDLRNWVSERLPALMVPGAWYIHERFPVSTNGKINRPILQKSGKRLEESDSPITEDFERPQTPTELVLASIWSSILGQEEIPADRGFFDIGGDSLSALRMVLEVERQLDTKLPLGTLLHASNISDLAALIDSLQIGEGASFSANLVSLRSKDSESNAAPLFLVHGGDGGTLIFHQLDHHITHDRPIYGLESPALTSPEKRAPNIPSIARDYIQQLKNVSPSGPYLIGGYSFGGVVAYEMARQLTAENHEVPLVLLFDTPAPNVEYPQRNLWGRICWYWKRCQQENRSVFRCLLAMGRRFVGGCLNSVRFKIEDFYAIAFRQSATGGPWAFRHLIVRDHHNRIAEQYVPENYTGNLVLLRAQNQGDKFSPSPSLGWDQLVGERIRIIGVPGEHMTILKSPHIHQLAIEVEKILEPLP